MNDDVLIDTNILVYLFDISEKKKQQHCKKTVTRLKEEKKAVLSNQILAELSAVLLTKIRHPLPPETVETIVEGFSASSQWKKISYSPQTVGKAVFLAKKYSLPFWNALITATMIEHNMFTICTENEKDFKPIPGFSVINPLK